MREATPCLLDLFSVERRLLFGTAQGFSSKSNPLFFQEVPVHPGSVNPISKNNLRVATVSAFVILHMDYKVLAFTKGVPAQTVYPGNSINKTYAEFGSKLHIVSCLAADNRTNIGLRDVDYPVIATIRLVLVHLALLSIHMLDDPVQSLISGRQRKLLKCIKESINIRHVPSDIL